MKKIFFALIFLGLFMASCSTYRCYPSKGSRDYAMVIKLTMTPEGYMHSVADTMGERFVALYECLPDSVKVGSIVWVGNYKRLSTGSKMRLNLMPGNGKGLGASSAPF